VSSPAPYLGLRALVFAGVTATLAAGAHVAAGGALPPTAPLAAGVLLTALAARTAGRRERRLPAVLVSVALTQLGFHVAFLGAHQHAHAAGGLRMVATHTLAAAAVARWLRGGEARVWAASRRAADLVATGLARVGVRLTRVAPPAVAALPRLTAPAEERPGGELRLLAASVCRRGPPPLLLRPRCSPS